MATDPRVQRARQLRREITLEDRLLWSRLRRSQLGVKFRRQVPIGSYVADFASVETKLVVELDGSQHAGRAYDVARDRVLTARGYRVLRLWNYEVQRGLDEVVGAISRAIAAD